MRVLITGASGYLGSRLAGNLRSAGAAVGLLLRRTSSLRRLGDAVDGEILRFDTPGDAARVVAGFRPSHVLHTACAYGRAGEGLLQMVEANHTLGIAVLQGAVEGGAGCFLNIGTPLPAAQNLYAFTKAQFAALAGFVPRRGMKFITVMLQTMYGPDDDGQKFPTRLVDDCLAGVPELQMTPGGQLRDFVYIDDVVSALATLVRRDQDLTDGEAIDLGSGAPFRLRDFAEMVVAATGGGTKLVGNLPYRPHEPMEMRADIARISSLGWQPKVSLAEGIRRMVAARRAA
jgi:nucleoside-diphosphate-sugar epimerase